MWHTIITQPKGFNNTDPVHIYPVYIYVYSNIISNENYPVISGLTNVHSSNSYTIWHFYIRTLVTTAYLFYPWILKPMLVWPTVNVS